jgi:hypothetical protein
MTSGNANDPFRGLPGICGRRCYGSHLPALFVRLIADRFASARRLLLLIFLGIIRRGKTNSTTNFLGDGARAADRTTG